MHIVLTSDSWEDTNTILMAILMPLANALNSFFVDEFYGKPERFMAVVVAVDSDAEINGKIAKKYNRIGNDRHPISNERVQYISVALPFDPNTILARTLIENKIAICESIIQKVGNPEVKIPKEFDYLRFSSDLNERLEILKRARLE